MAHMTVAVNEKTFRKAADVFLKNFVFEKQDSTDSGAFTVSYHVKGHLEGGTIDLRADNTVEIKELDLKWDKLQVSIGLDIEKKCVGGGCLGPFCLPEVCIFKDDPDVAITLDFASVFAQELTVTGSMAARYFNVLTPPALGALCQLLRTQLINNGVIDPFDNNEWQLFIDPDSIDLDLFDFPDIVGDLIENALTTAIEAIIPGGAVKDLLLAIIGSIADLIRDVLDIGDDLDEWLSDIFNISFGLGDFIITAIADFLGHCLPVFRIEDPLELMPATNTGLVPVTIPIRNLSVRVDAAEMVVQADVGA
jgi:hypothetical protein